MANKANFAPKPKPPGPIETAFIIRKLSLSEWQRVDLKIQDGVVIERIEREPNISAIIARNLTHDLVRNDG